MEFNVQLQLAGLLEWMARQMTACHGKTAVIGISGGKDKRIRVHVDAENYRARREASLESLAMKVAAKVKKYRRSVTLEAMNAYERHVIHAALQDVKGVTTYSVGTEPNRRVVVACDRESN